MKILVVDDSATIRDRLVDILSALQGVDQVDTAARASEARDAIQSAPPDVLVLDIHMPGGSGLDVLDGLRADHQRIMTIVLTNDPAAQWRAASLRAGADFFFDKSVEFQQAVDVIARLARGHVVPSDPLPSCWASFERLPIPSWIFDVDSLEFMVVNDAAVARYGYSREEFLNMTLVEIRPPEGVPELMEQIAKRRAGETIESIGMRRHRAKNGATIYAELSLVPIEHDNRRLDLVLAHDISARICAEAALRVNEQGLRQAQKMEAIGRLASGVAHDFNNLLTIVIGNSQEILQRLKPEDPLHVSVAQILTAGEYGADLTRQLLAFSRQQVLDPKVLDLNVVVDRLAPILRRLIGSEIDLVLHTAAAHAAVQADSGQLEQVIMNLVVNARDAIAEGSTGTLTIETANVNVPGREAAGQQPSQLFPHVVLIVRDTGRGMDEQVKTRIFEPFFSNREGDTGTGLGLSTVYGIVKQSGGHIVVDSEPGQGTTFSVYFPCATGGGDLE